MTFLQLAMNDRREGELGGSEEGEPLNQVNGFYEHTFDGSPAVHSNPRWNTSRAYSGHRIARFLSTALVVLLSALFLHAKYTVRRICPHAHLMSSQSP